MSHSFFMMLLVFIISSYVQMNCCKHHIIAPTGFEPIKLFAVKNTDMFRRFSTTDKLGQWEKMESNHPNHNGNRFTICPATSTEYSPKTRGFRVSNMFIVLCFPLDCFMLCQPHRVVSDIIMPFGAILCFLKTPLSSMRACDGLLKLRNIYRTGNQIKHKPMPLHIFAHSDSHTLIREFFLPIKRMGSIRKKWKF